MVLIDVGDLTISPGTNVPGQSNTNVLEALVPTPILEQAGANVLRDMLSVDKDGKFIRKTNLLLIARQNGKTHLLQD